MNHRIDTSHPSLHGFEIIYKWKNAEVEDPVFGLQVLCGTSLIAFMIIFIVIVVAAEEEDSIGQKVETQQNKNNNKVVIAPEQRDSRARQYH